MPHSSQHYRDGWSLSALAPVTINSNSIATRINTSSFRNNRASINWASFSARGKALTFLGRETVEVCRECHEVLALEYWRIDGDVMCKRCAEGRQREAEAEMRASFWRGLRFGAIAAVATAFGQAAMWTLIAQINLKGAWDLRTHLEIPVALTAGAIVGVTVRVGSNRSGGWPLQATAAALVYLAYVASAVIAGSRGTVAMVAMSLLRTFVAPLFILGPNPVGLPRLIDAVFAMGLAWQVNREGKRVAVSGPFGYAVR